MTQEENILSEEFMKRMGELADEYLKKQGTHDKPHITRHDFVSGYLSHQAEYFAQLSSKEQELKTVLEEIVEERKSRECEFIKLKQQHKAKVDEVTQYARFFEEEQKRADSLRAERDKWKEDCIHNANRALEIIAERDTLRKRCEHLEAAIREAISGLDF